MWTGNDKVDIHTQYKVLILLVPYVSDFDVNLNKYMFIILQFSSSYAINNFILIARNLYYFEFCYLIIRKQCVLDLILSLFLTFRI